MSVSVFAPASIGNVNVGFDVLGLAVKPLDGTLLGDVVTVTHSNGDDQLEVTGSFAKKLPSDVKQNIVWHCLLLFNEQLLASKQAVVAVKVTLDKRMPVGSGLGSSACSVVAALAGLNAFYEKYHEFSFSEQALLKMMGQMEAQISGSLHYDILPTSYSRADLISFGQNLATFVDACHRGDKAQAFGVLTDVVAEPYRESILPGYSAAASHLRAEGCLAVGISGSGPTLFCVTDDAGKAEKFANWLTENYLQTSTNGTSDGFVHVCRADTEGAVSLP